MHSDPCFLAGLVGGAVLMQERGFHHTAGVVGVLSSLLIVALIAGSATYMTMTSLLRVLVAQLVWNAAAAVLLVRKPVNTGAFSWQADRDAAMQVMT